ncbi:MAG: hypothetical protein EAX96_09925, partial [Candidatus Lokiarchaeota archaeon]|nr:hypothetical protein [Candidatus Lokiarchaeota archaeon]
MIETYQFLGKDKETYLEKYPFLNSFECRKWVRNLETRAKGKKGFTKQNFCNNLGRLLKYLEFTDMTPTELIDEAEKDSKLDRRERENPASYRIRQFFQY